MTTKQALKADAQRLAGLKKKHAVMAEAGLANGEDDEKYARLKILIAIYEECAARGRTFGGVT